MKTKPMTHNFTHLETALTISKHDNTNYTDDKMPQIEEGCVVLKRLHSVFRKTCWILHTTTLTTASDQSSRGETTQHYIFGVLALDSALRDPAAIDVKSAVPAKPPLSLSVPAPLPPP